jgi:hypothetical protein
MMHSWIGERMADEHRRDLTASTRPEMRGDSYRTDLTVADIDRIDAIVSHRGPDGHAPRRAIGPQVGTFLIRMGTRLGGASMRTS